MKVVQTMDQIKVILLISGKRKCGKDFVSQKLIQRLNYHAQIVHISAPIKNEWAEKHNLDLCKLLSDGPYKEKYRKDMIIWSDKMRSLDFGIFCRRAMENVCAEIVIVSDIRRRTDVKYFRDTYGDRVKTIRIQSPETIRIERGWIKTVGIDDVQSECDLDNYHQWDLVLDNDNSRTIDELIDRIISAFSLKTTSV